MKKKQKSLRNADFDAKIAKKSLKNLWFLCISVLKKLSTETRRTQKLAENILLFFHHFSYHFACFGADFYKINACGQMGNVNIFVTSDR